MARGIRAAVLPAIVVAASFVIHADVTPQSQSSEIQVQIGNEFLAEGRYVDAIDAFQRALVGLDPGEARVARAGIIQAALKLALFDAARVQSEALLKTMPADPAALALHGDAVWASGLFEEAEARYKQALAISPDLARAHHGMARSLAAQGQLEGAMDAAQHALRLTPRDGEIHHTVGTIYERQHKYEEAANAFSNYVNLLPNKDRSEKADWSRSEIKFLRSFGQRVPLEMDPEDANETHTVEFRVVNEKVMVRAKVNESTFQEFVVDTGAESTVITGATARRLGVTPITYTLSAGVGDVGLRGLQLARINSLELGTLKLRNVPCLVKDPPLRNLPTREVESLSPLSLGFSMIIDYKTRKITFGKRLPEEPSDFELPLRMHRLATVRGMVDGRHAANFVVDTGGQVISISQATATQLGRPADQRKIALRVYGSSGWDRDAFLMQGVDLAFDAIHFQNLNVAVLNLNAPSALLGFQVGGIVGHNFLKKYRVAIDLERSVLRLKDIS
jgi:tetratricopeptide (TPR) repeat protein